MISRCCTPCGSSFSTGKLELTNLVSYCSRGGYLAYGTTTVSYLSSFRSSATNLARFCLYWYGT